MPLVITWSFLDLQKSDQPESSASTGNTHPGKGRKGTLPISGVLPLPAGCSWVCQQVHACAHGLELVWREVGGLSGCRAALRECAVVVFSLYVWLLEAIYGWD
jgi:hypothetical protein